MKRVLEPPPRVDLPKDRAPFEDMVVEEVGAAGAGKKGEEGVLSVVMVIQGRIDGK